MFNIFINSLIYILRYISLTIGGMIMELILSRQRKSRKAINDDDLNNNEDNEEGLLTQQTLIFNEDKTSSRRKTKEIIFATFAYCFPNEIINLLFLFGFDRLDIYPFEILYVLYFMKKYFVINIHNFKKIAIVITIVPVTILLIISAILPFTKHYCYEDKNKDKTAYQIVEDMTGSMFYIIPIIAALIISEIILAYGRVKTKVLMDLRYISPYRMTFYIGICGTFLILIAFIILPFVKCNDRMAVFCKVTESDENLENNNSTELYIDNPLFYLKHMKETQQNLYIEGFVVIPIFLILSFAEFICEIFIIYHFNPNYIFVKNDIYYIIIRLLFIIINFNKNYNHYISFPQFIILELTELFSILGYGIYLEIIELRFCGLDKYLKRNIIKRAKHTNSISNSNENNENNENSNDNNNANNNSSDIRIYSSIGSEEIISEQFSMVE